MFSVAKVCEEKLSVLHENIRKQVLAIYPLQNSIFKSSTSPDDSQKLKDKFVGRTQQLQN